MLPFKQTPTEPTHLGQSIIDGSNVALQTPVRQVVRGVYKQITTHGHPTAHHQRPLSPGGARRGGVVDGDRPAKDVGLGEIRNDSGIIADRTASLGMP